MVRLFVCWFDHLIFVLLLSLLFAVVVSFSLSVRTLCIHTHFRCCSRNFTAGGGGIKEEQMVPGSKNQTSSDCGIPLPASKPKIWSLADTAACKTPPPIVQSQHGAWMTNPYHHSHTHPHSSSNNPHSHQSGDLSSMMMGNSPTNQIGSNSVLQGSQTNAMIDFAPYHSLLSHHHLLFSCLNWTQQADWTQFWFDLILLLYTKCNLSIFSGTDDDADSDADDHDPCAMNTQWAVRIQSRIPVICTILNSTRLRIRKQ